MKRANKEPFYPKSNKYSTKMPYSYNKFKHNVREHILLELQNTSNPRVLDVGAGSGYFASKFKDLNPKIEAFCIDPFYSQSDLGKKNGMNFVLKSPQDQADTLLFIDVLEHVEDDARRLR